MCLFIVNLCYASGYGTFPLSNGPSLLLLWPSRCPVRAGVRTCYPMLGLVLFMSLAGCHCNVLDYDIFILCICQWSVLTDIALDVCLEIAEKGYSLMICKMSTDAFLSPCTECAHRVARCNLSDNVSLM